MTPKEITTKVKALIAKDELQKALNLLTVTYTDNDQVDQLVLQSAQFHSLKKDQQKGIIDYGEQQKYFNQFRSNIINFVNDLPAIKITDNKSAKKELKITYQLAKARNETLKILMELETAETISKIYLFSKIKQRKLVVVCLNELAEVGYVEKKKIGSSVSWLLTDSGISFAKSLM